MMRSRAQKLGDYLEDACGWNVWDIKATVANCVCGEAVDTNFCPNCGRKNDKVEIDTLKQLEAAIAYALDNSIE
jgi:hypothetical protein